MARTVESTVYQFGELSDDAKERARDWYRGRIESDELADNGDDWDEIATILGVWFDTHSVRLMGGGTRYDNSIYWSLDPVECSFDGSYSYAKGAPAAIRKHAPLDVELHRLADDLQRAQRTSFYRIACKLSCRDASFMRVEHIGDNPAARTTDEQLVSDSLRDFAYWMGKQVDLQRDWLFADEQVDESILANEYEFDEYGNRV